MDSLQDVQYNPSCTILDELPSDSLDVHSKGGRILIRQTDLYHPRRARINSQQKLFGRNKNSGEAPEIYGIRAGGAGVGVGVGTFKGVLNKRTIQRV